MRRRTWTQRLGDAALLGMLFFLTLGVLELWAPRDALPIETDSAMSFTAPAASLTVPFDATTDENGDARISFIRVSNVGGVSTPDLLGDVPQVETHFAAWDENCEHIANFSVCVTLNSTVIIDTTSAQAGIYDPERGIVTVGPEFNLTGSRGIITATAYETDRDCRPDVSVSPVDDALMGSWSIANLSTSATFGGNAWGHGLDDTGTYVELIRPGLDLDTIFLGTFDPSDVTNLVLAVGLRENAGKRSGELGPISETVTANSQICVPTEQCPSRPDVRASCLLVSRLDDPQLENIGSSGFFRLSGAFTENDDGTTSAVGSTENAVGKATQVYAVNGETIGTMGTDVYAYYTLTAPGVGPEPSPTPGCPLSCGEGFVCAPLPPSPCCDCQPEPEPSEEPEPTPTAVVATQTPSPTETPAPTQECCSIFPPSEPTPTEVIIGPAPAPPL